MIFKATVLSLCLATLPALAMAQQANKPPATPVEATTNTPAPMQNSRWSLLPSIMLEDVLYPAATQGAPAPLATVLGTGNSSLRSGHNVITTLVRLDNPEPRANGVRPSDYVRCYEYYTPNFSQDGTRCFVLQPRR